MKNKILIGEDNELEREILINILNKHFDCEIIEADNGLNILEKVKKEFPNIVLLDIDLPKLNGFQIVEKLKTDISTIDIPIIIISSLDKKEIVKKLIFKEVKDIITKPINEKSDLISKISNILNFESKFIGSYTNKFIKSFITFSSSQTKALYMISLLEAISHKIEIDIQKKMDMKAVLAILSTTIERNSLNKTIKLYSEMNFASDILTLLKSVKNPKTIYEEILYLIYEIAKADYKNKSIYDINFREVNAKLLIFMTKIVLENEIVVKSNLDLELVWTKLLDIISNEPKININLIDEFIYYAKKMLRKVLLKHGESIVKIINKKDKLKFLINIQQCSKDNLKSLIEQDLNKNIIKDIKDINGKKYLILALQKIQQNAKEKSKQIKQQIKRDIIEEKKTKVVENIEIEKIKLETKEQTLLQKSSMNAVSAKEYLSTLNIDYFDDLEEMRELEEELDSNLVFLSQHFNMEDLKDIGNIIFKYASRINNTFYEFEALGYGLTSLSNVIRNLENISNVNNIVAVNILLSDLKEDLSKWRENIFINQNAINAHYLDSSLLTSCMQIEAILTNKKIEGESIEFF